MNNSTTEQPPSMVDAHLSVSMIVINACSGILATVLNLLIIITFIKTPSLRTPSNVLILSLAITDFGVGALLQPLYCVYIYVDITGEIVLVDSVFEVLAPFATILFFVSIFMITAITVDRFLALHLHLRYQELVTTKRTSMVVIMIWTFSVLWKLLRFFSFKKTPAFGVAISHVGICVFLSLLILNIALMLKISRVIRQHAAQIQLQQQAMNAQPGAAVNIKKSVNIMYYIFGTFFLCYFPKICFWIIHTFSRNWKLVKVIAFNVVNTILYMNSSINPIIYFWRIQDMRNAALQLLRSIRGSNNSNNNNNNNNSNNNNSSNNNNINNNNDNNNNDDNKNAL